MRASIGGTMLAALCLLATSCTSCTSSSVRSGGEGGQCAFGVEWNGVHYFDPIASGGHAELPKASGHYLGIGHDLCTDGGPSNATWRLYSVPGVSPDVAVTTEDVRYIGIAEGKEVPEQLQRPGSKVGAAPTDSTRCPKTAPRVVGPHAVRVPAENGEPLFGRPVAGLTACSYDDMRPSHGPRAVPLSHTLARRLAQRLNEASTTANDPLLCLERLTFTVLLPRDDRGDELAPVTLIPGCRQVTATNGTTARHLADDDRVLRKAERYLARALTHR